LQAAHRPIPASAAARSAVWTRFGIGSDPRSGVHAPMREELTLENLPVTGAIPPGLDGLYLKMG
jgi:hypothetical protein